MSPRALQPERDPRWDARERPVQTEDTGAMGGTTETHPAYATIGANRVSGSGGILFQSDFRHDHYMTIKISRAKFHRTGSTDYVFGNRELIEVALSEAQWATFVSSPNMGSGVPCTLKYLDGPVPQIEPITNRREQFRGEVDAHMQDALASLAELGAALETANLSGKARDELKRKVDRARMQISGNLSYVAERFDEHAEETIEKAKMEVNAYVTGTIQRAGLAALGGSMQLDLIEGPGATED